ncbi:YihY/virulence factor BrkB family protein [Noviherbaspirillum sp. CPCC 100848]|uniref:YihY/virulence factor BrkB family protein n=1 Tax=Noviherbaspirillum album TaxID=3080276 RepID=A0ABU6J260_9BURK|nr:YihY/virulence factor BrkB family protein [Noviherbaspirillum sp. CPCC 100848]MEC4717598.1 YihY/virulence factor BrkB family protein [Noviherbaspirillum sp. CPCC 100848]
MCNGCSYRPDASKASPSIVHKPVMATWIYTLRFRMRLFKNVVRLALRKFMHDDMTTYASALAYHMLFSFFPFAIFLFAVLSFFDLSILLDSIQQAAWHALSPKAMERVRAAFNELRVPQGGLLSFGVLLSIWLASRGTRSMMKALNVAYGTTFNRPAWQSYLASIAYTLGIAVILIAGTGMLVIGPEAIRWVGYFVGLEDTAVMLWTWLRWPAGLFLLMAATAIVYHIVPDAANPFRLVSPGAIISVLVWVAASLAFKYYLQHFASYSAMFGSIGSGIALLLYLQLSTSVLLFGAEVNAVWAKLSRAAHAS